jgi:enoyl-CoA hydratase
MGDIDAVLHVEHRELKRGFGESRSAAIITIVRPKALNALNGEVLRSLATTVDALATDRGIAGVVVTGSGEKAFVAGADIKEISTLTPEEALQFARTGQRLFRRLSELPFPVIAAVNGFALGGGCELALACDWIYATPEAKLGLPEATLGLIPGFGGTVRLARRIGSARALEWTLSATPISAEEAHRVGLVQRVLPREELMPAALSTIEMIAQRGPGAVAHIKRSVHEGLSLGSAAHEELEAQLFSRCFVGEEAREGTRAFVEKRAPQFAPRLLGGRTS